jgi:hypothetical protein
MIRRILFPASIIALLATTGCSSSSSNTGTGNDSGTTNENDSSTGGGDTGTTTEMDSGTTVEDTGTTTMGDTGTTTSDAATCTAATTVTGLPPYTAATHQAVCTNAQIAAFLTACSSAGAPGACDAWFGADAGNDSCAACIAPQTDAGTLTTGALLSDVNGGNYLNTAACVQIASSDTACATDLQNLILCEGDACNINVCTGAADQTCQGNAQTGACMQYLTSANTDCGALGADGGALAMGGACDANNNPGGVIGVICGTGN